MASGKVKLNLQTCSEIDLLYMEKVKTMSSIADNTSIGYLINEVDQFDWKKKILQL
jgi:hypothetical protein